MKFGMKALSPYEVASLRVLSAGIILLPFSIQSFRKIPKSKLPFVWLSGIFGSFFPAFLYCIAEVKIDSSLAAILNALTPLFAILIGILFFKLQVTWLKMFGVLIGFAGLLLLPFAGGESINVSQLSYGSLVLIATVCYGINVNMVATYLHDVASIHIASMAFAFLIIPCIVVLAVSGYFESTFSSADFISSTVASVVLGMFGTAIASILFYILVKKAGTIFSSLVTYGIPFVAITWGLLYNEKITFAQLGCLGIILAGVYLVNKKKI